MAALVRECHKFNPNIFDKSKCANCFRLKSLHCAEALDVGKASRRIARCGYLFVAPDWDLSNPVQRAKRWPRRWFVLFEDGELTYSVDDHPDTVPQAVIDMNGVFEITAADAITGNEHSIAIVAPNGVHFIKGSCKEESRLWLDILKLFANTRGTFHKDGLGGGGAGGSSGAGGRAKRSATFPGLRKWPSAPAPVVATHSPAPVPVAKVSVVAPLRETVSKEDSSESDDEAAVEYVVAQGRRGSPDGCGIVAKDDSVKVKKGWLMKEDGVTKKLVQHWFVAQDGALFYYRDPKAETNGFLDGVIDLNMVQSLDLCNIGRNFGFTLRTGDSKVHKLSSVTLRTRDKWVDVISRFAHLKSPTTAAAATPSPPPSSPSTSSSSSSLAPSSKASSASSVTNDEQDDDLSDDHVTSVKPEPVAVPPPVVRTTEQRPLASESREVPRLSISATESAAAAAAAAMKLQMQMKLQTALAEATSLRESVVRLETSLHLQERKLQICQTRLADAQKDILLEQDKKVKALQETAQLKRLYETLLEQHSRLQDRVVQVEVEASRKVSQSYEELEAKENVIADLSEQLKDSEERVFAVLEQLDNIQHHRADVRDTSAQTLDEDEVDTAIIGVLKDRLRCCEEEADALEISNWEMAQELEREREAAREQEKSFASRIEDLANKLYLTEKSLRQVKERRQSRHSRTKRDE